MKAPRSDVVFRRFMAGESVEDIVNRGPGKWHDVGDGDPYKVPDWSHENVESALRRAFAKNRKRRSR